MLTLTFKLILIIYHPHHYQYQRRATLSKQNSPWCLQYIIHQPALLARSHRVCHFQSALRRRQCFITAIRNPNLVTSQNLMLATRIICGWSVRLVSCVIYGSRNQLEFNVGMC